MYVALHTAVSKHAPTRAQRATAVAPTVPVQQASCMASRMAYTRAAGLVRKVSPSSSPRLPGEFADMSHAVGSSDIVEVPEKKLKGAEHGSCGSFGQSGPPFFEGTIGKLLLG